MQAAFFPALFFFFLVVSRAIAGEYQCDLFLLNLITQFFQPFNFVGPTYFAALLSQGKATLFLLLFRCFAIVFFSCKTFFFSCSSAI